MRAQPKEIDLPLRLPLVGLLNQRVAPSGRDSRLINGYVEVGSDEVLRVTKRPGLALGFNRPGFAAGAFGQYDFYYVPVEGGYTGRLYLGSTLVLSFGAYTSTVSPPDRFLSSELVVDGSAPDGRAYLVHDGFRVWKLPLSGGAVTTAIPIPLGETVITLAGCTTTSGSPVVTVASTSDLPQLSSTTSTPFATGSFVESIDSATQFTMDAPASASGTFTLVFSAAGPGRAGGGVRLVPGVVDLNNSSYLLSPDSFLYGSEISQPSVWNPLNRIQAYANQDTAVALSKQLSYIIVFKTESTEFFRDVGLSPGSPLERLEGLRLDIGCANGRTVSSLDGRVIWASRSPTNARSVWILDGAKPAEIATPAVRRILELSPPDYATSFSASGHAFYALTKRSTYTLIFDLTSGLWSYWSALGSQAFPFPFAVPTDSSTTRLLHESNGNSYSLDPFLATDAGVGVTLEIFPPDFDANMRVSKYLNRMYVICDRSSGGVLEVRTNDFDGDPARWTDWRQFDLGLTRPSIYKCGTFSRRLFHFRHASPQYFRGVSVELDIQACPV